MKSRSLHTGSVFIAYLITLLCFLATDVYTMVRLKEVTSQWADIAENAMPSIVHVAGARSELRHLEHLMDDAVEGKINDAPIDAALSNLENHVANYHELPQFPGESALWFEAQASLEAVRNGMLRVRAFLDAGDHRRASRVFDSDVRAAADRADAALRRVVELNETEGQAAGRAASVTHRHVSNLSLALDVFTLVGSMAAMVFAIRTSLRYARLAQRRTEELEAFASRVAHDIRGPLTPAVLALGCAARECEGPTRTLAERGSRSLERVTALVNDLLAFAMGNAEPQAGARARVNDAVQDVLVETEALAAERATTVVVTPFEQVEVACAPGVLTSIVSNLVRNAIKYIGKSVVRQVTVRVNVRSSNVLLEVSDTGPGLSPAMQQAIFDPYVRGPSSAEPGLGLGLATVKRLVEAHGGKVGVRSAEGHGSHFWVELPRAS